MRALKLAASPMAALAALALALSFSCSTETSGGDNETLADAVDPDDYSDSAADESSDTYNADDVLSSYSFTTVQVDLDDLSAGTLADGVTLELTDSGAEITSTNSGYLTFSLSGSLDGSLSIDSESTFQVVLAGVDISAEEDAALSLTSEARAFVTSASGTSNTLSDSAGSSAGQKAALYCKGPLILGGAGSIVVNANLKHGIYSKDYIRFTGGTVEVNATARDAVRSVNGVIVDDVDLKIAATGTETDDESKGIKVEGDDDSEYGQDKGFIVINGGTLSITSVSKAISAGWDIDEDLGDNELGNPDPYVTINSGYITIKTTGTPYETTDEDGETISLSPEGIEGKSRLKINNGYIVIESSDDCLNAGDSITINGGYVYCDSSDNDAIDSNGDMYLNGGVLVALGAASPESAFDTDEGTFAITGGLLLGAAGSTSSPTSSACTQRVVVLNGLSSSLAGKTISIQDSSGNVAFAGEIGSIAACVVLSSPELESGTTYTVIAGADNTADTEFYGLCDGSISSVGGSTATSFTTSSMVTTVGTTQGPNGR